MASGSRDAATSALRLSTQRSEEHYRDLFEYAGDMIVAVDLHWNITDANRATAATLDYSVEELVHMNLAQVLPPEMHDLARAQLQRKLDGDVTATTYEHDFVTRDGRRVPVEVKTRIIRADGNPIGVEAVARDITERRGLEERLRQITALVDSTEDAVIGTTQTGIITSWNHGAELIYGWTAAETIGRSLEMVVPPTTPDAVSRSMRALASGGEAVIRHNAKGLHRDGHEFDVALTVCPVFEAGVLVAVSTVARDISQAVQAEAEREWLVGELERQNEQLRALDRVKDEFVASVSHELRTPLTSIRGYLEIFRDDVVLDEEHDQMLAVVDRNAERLLHLIDDLLLTAQIAADKPLNLNRELVDLADIVGQVVEDAEPLAADASVALDVSLAETTVLGDGMRIAQVVDNLISNGIKFSLPGGVVRIALKGDADHVVISVADTGIGIPPEDLDLIFSPFYRTNAAAQGAIKGTGLGLAIVKAIVDAHGGAITFTSERGIGTTVEVALPRHELERP